MIKKFDDDFQLEGYEFRNDKILFNIETKLKILFLKFIDMF